MNIIEKEKIEIEFWKNSLTENPSNFTTENILNKISEAKVFYKLFKKYKQLFKSADSILELGGGQGWASCLIKRELSYKKVFLSDISEFAIESLKYWEKLFDVKLDNSFTCKSYEISMPDESVELIFCFAAAHHFVKHKESLVEIKRVLKPGGKCIYMYEPCCKKFIYPLAYKRVNKKRPEVPEDLLISKNILLFARDIDLIAKSDFYFSTESRGAIPTIYYFIMGKLPFLAKILPCTENFIFEKK